MRFPGSTVAKNPPVNTGVISEAGSILGLGRSPGKGNRNTLQYSCPENPLDRGGWWAAVHRIAGLDTTEQLTLLLSHTLHHLNLYLYLQKVSKHNFSRSSLPPP